MMMLLIRALVVIALAVLAVTPPHVHGASPEVDHGFAANHHHHGPEHDGAQDHDDPGTQVCCASVSLHCGSPALAGESGWTPAEPLPIEVNQKLDFCVRAASSLPEFEPPPPRI